MASGDNGVSVRAPLRGSGSIASYADSSSTQTPYNQQFRPPTPPRPRGRGREYDFDDDRTETASHWSYYSPDFTVNGGDPPAFMRVIPPGPPPTRSPPAPPSSPGSGRGYHFDDDGPDVVPPPPSYFDSSTSASNGGRSSRRSRRRRRNHRGRSQGSERSATPRLDTRSAALGEAEHVLVSPAVTSGSSARDAAAYGSALNPLPPRIPQHVIARETTERRETTTWYAPSNGQPGSCTTTTTTTTTRTGPLLPGTTGPPPVMDDSSLQPRTYEWYQPPAAPYFVYPGCPVYFPPPQPPGGFPCWYQTHQ
ncbi:hypothetical protein BN946_scf184943.g16 [Trametes cinnabarina]|uniref:Uncharacterized protein n=1 Tax=Pycnoporus cinnabarinus TaxID=5643 RepID=A0A060SBU2_PYCCI|nr:hypothetical protein BN946_scf184943.g16 [Trametes cinnabarina]